LASQAFFPSGFGEVFVALTHLTSIPHAEASIRNAVARDDPSVVDIRRVERCALSGPAACRRAPIP
jgi:hypothetical protein